MVEGSGRSDIGRAGRIRGEDRKRSKQKPDQGDPPSKESDMSGSGTNAPALITKVEAARILGVSRFTVIRLVQRGALREVRLGDGMNPRLVREEVVALARGDSQ